MQVAKVFYEFFIWVFSSFVLTFNFQFVKLYCTKKHNVYNLYCISYTLSFSSVMYYKVSEIYIDGRFFQGCLYFYSQQFTSAVVKTALILYNLPYNLPYIPDRELLLTWNLVDITSNLKAFKKQKICWIRRDIFCLRHHMSAFSNLNFDLLLLDWVL